MSLCAESSCIAGSFGAFFGSLLLVAGVSGGIAVGDSVTVKVDYGRRGQIVPNHTFTHVLNFALRETLGDHVDQKGSIVLPDK